MAKHTDLIESDAFPGLRAWMKRTATTQEHLASLLGISESSMSRRLDGSKSFEWQEASRLSLITGVPVVELLPPAEASEFMKLLGAQPTTDSENAK